MNFVESLIKELKTITKLNNHIYPANAPEKVRKEGVPYLILLSSVGVKTKSLNGYSGGKQVSVELNVVASTYSKMQEISQQVVALLEGMEQRNIGETGPFVQELTYYEPKEFYESAPQLYRCLIDLEVFYEEVKQ